MNRELDKAGTPMPILRLDIEGKGVESQNQTVLPTKQYSLDITLHRDHALPPDAEIPEALAPQGIYEAFYLILEGLMGEGKPNHLVSIQPAIVKDLTEKTIKVPITFVAPEKPGQYSLRIHLTTNSIVGVYLSQDISFEVIEDDVPTLQ